MVLIPNDIGIRMRLQNEAQLLQPPAPITEILGDLPEFRPGAQFTARILETLPQGTYKALVAGKELTLSLTEGAKAGDTLELVVIDRSNKVLIAQLAPKTDAGNDVGTPYPHTNLSRAAQLIGSLLPDEGASAPPAPLNAGKPVLDTAPTSAPQLAAALKDAVRSSGVFYEAHQAQWVTGRFPLAQLLQEPQAQHSDFAKLVNHLVQSSGNAAAPPASGTVPLPTGAPVTSSHGNVAAEAAGHPAPSPTGGTPSEDASTKSALTGRRFDSTDEARGGTARASDAGTGAVAAAARNIVEASDTSAAGAQRLPEDVRPLVQQQLDALATDRLVWHGEAWPRQMVEWQIEREARNSGGGEDDDSRWNTTLALTTPRLGRIDAKLQLSHAGVRIVIAADTPESVEALRAAQGRLGASLDASGVPLLGMLIKPAETASEGA